MPESPKRAVTGAVVRPIIGGAETGCSTDACPDIAAWVVHREMGDEDYVYYSCDGHLWSAAHSAIEEDGDD